MITCCLNRATLFSFGISPESSSLTDTDRHNHIDQLQSSCTRLICVGTLRHPILERCSVRNENIHRLLTCFHALIWNWEKTKWVVQQYPRSLSLLLYNMIWLLRNYLQLILILNKYFALPFMDNTIWYRWMEKRIFSFSTLRKGEFVANETYPRGVFRLVRYLSRNES